MAARWSWPLGGGLRYNPARLRPTSLSDKSGTAPETSPLLSLSFWSLLFFLSALVCYCLFGLLVCVQAAEKRINFLSIRASHAGIGLDP